MENLKVHKPKFKWFEILIALSFIVPYLEIDLVRDFLEYNSKGVIIPSIIPIMFIISLMLLIMMMLKKRPRFSNKINTLIYIKILLDIIILLRGFYVENFLVFFAQFLWFVVPFYYAILIIKFIYHFDLKLSNIAKVGIFYFSIYLLINIMINIQSYGFELTGSVTQTRLISPGGGAVVLGYTIVLMMCLVLYLRYKMLKINTLLIVSILLIASLLTGSRGAIWPIIFLGVLYVITNKNSKAQIISFVVFIITISIINPLAVLNNAVPRIMNISGGTRADTFFNGMSIFFDQTIFNIFLGTGLSGTFPYQAWLSNFESTLNLISYNTFLYNDNIMLVQPHNSYLYLLLETGLIGLILYISIFIYCLYLVKKQNTRNKIYKYLLILFIIQLNYLDSVFIIQPGSAGLWWLILFIIVFVNGKDRIEIVKDTL